MALSREWPEFGVLPQSLQLHPSQNRSAAKHSQYNLRHLERLQLQRLPLEEPGDFFLVELFSFPLEEGTLRAAELRADEGAIKGVLGV